MNQKEQKEKISPLFHFSSKRDAIIIDSQYTFDGTYLAVCTSAATILIYKSPIEQNILNETDLTPFIEYRNPNPKNTFLKLAWSFFDANLATISIARQISYFSLTKDILSLDKTKKCTSIPVFCCFLPSTQEFVCSVGFSDGTIGLFDQKLQQIVLVKGHEQSVNWLSWERRLGTSQRNKWVSEHFPTHVSQDLTRAPPYLVSGSSDTFIHIWKMQKHNLILLHKFKAHDKQIRQVMWKPNYFSQSKLRHLVSCSEDHQVNFWQISISSNKTQSKMNSQRNFLGPVYRSQYNLLGTLISISYYHAEQGKIQTKIFTDKECGIGEELKME